jgi:hypothetical protein
VEAALPGPTAHCGIAESDPRNRGPIAFFKPHDITAESARVSLARAIPRASPAEIEARVRQLMERIAAKPHKPPPPLSQPLDAVDDPRYGLGTHPDLISRLWKLDDTLPRRCRWVTWGRPSLVHPNTGVIFAVAFGTIGIVMRLPTAVLSQAASQDAAIVITGNPGQTFDIGPAGSEWRFVRPRAPENEWCLAAHEYAARAGS